MTDRTTRDAKNASEGELLRNQIRDGLEPVIAKIMEDWDEGGQFAQYEELGWRYSEIMADLLADAILARFDVRLREPQAEEWDQRVPTTETQARWAYDRILDVYATVEGTELTDNRWGQVLTDLGELMKRLDAIDRSGRREPQAEETR